MSIAKTLSLALAFSAAAAAATALAQPAPNKGEPSSPAANRMQISATKPFQLVAKDDHGKFRMMFRVLAASETELPATLVGNQRETYGWLSFTSSGARCKVSSREVEGMSVFGQTTTYDLETQVKQLNKTAESEWHLHKTRPTVVVADFECDGKIAKDEGLTVSTRFYIYDGTAWKAADFTFENLTIGSK